MDNRLTNLANIFRTMRRNVYEFTEQTTARPRQIILSENLYQAIESTVSIRPLIFEGLPVTSNRELGLNEVKVI